MDTSCSEDSQKLETVADLITGVLSLTSGEVYFTLRKHGYSQEESKLISEEADQRAHKILELFSPEIRDFMQNTPLPVSLQRNEVLNRYAQRTHARQLVDQLITKSAEEITKQPWKDWPSLTPEDLARAEEFYRRNKPGYDYLAQDD